MLNNKHSVADFQQAMEEAKQRNIEEIEEYGDDLEVVLDDLDTALDWYEISMEEDYLTI